MGIGSNNRGWVFIGCSVRFRVMGVVWGFILGECAVDGYGCSLGVRSGCVCELGFFFSRGNYGVRGMIMGLVVQSMGSKVYWYPQGYGMRLYVRFRDYYDTVVCIHYVLSLASTTAPTNTTITTNNNTATSTVPLLLLHTTATPYHHHYSTSTPYQYYSISIRLH